jgi:hypothetical protein
VSDDSDIPTLTDLIEDDDVDVGEEIRLSDLGLDADDPIVRDVEIDMDDPDLEPVDPLADNPELEQTIRRILDDHMERAWQEIRIAIRNQLDKS